MEEAPEKLEIFRLGEPKPLASKGWTGNPAVQERAGRYRKEFTWVCKNIRPLRIGVLRYSLRVIAVNFRISKSVRQQLGMIDVEKLVQQDRTLVVVQGCGERHCVAAGVMASTWRPEDHTD
jgi:hypothetical protein